MGNNKRSGNVSFLNGFWVNDWGFNIRMLVVFAALEIILAYSPFGFVILPTISVTTLFLGVMVAALWGGPVQGAAVGLVFGLASMWKASVTATNANDLIFSPVMSGDPLGSIALALGPRVLFGVVAGLVYFAIMSLPPRNHLSRVPLLLVASAALERVNSMLTYLFMDKVFHVEGVTLLKAFNHLFSTNRLQTYLVCMVVVLLAYIFFEKYLSKAYYDQYCQIKAMPEVASLRANIKYPILTVVVVAVVAITALHLWDRVQIVLFDIDRLPSEAVDIDRIAQVIFQNISAMLAAMYIVTVVYKHARNVEELERTRAVVQLDIQRQKAEQMEQRSLEDPLTGLYNRKGFKKVVAEEGLDSRPVGFLLVDIDHFKEINDDYGHEAGDSVLLKLSGLLAKQFGEARVFRFGGDEFAALIVGDGVRTRDELLLGCEKVIEGFEQMHRELAGLLGQDVAVTLSVGACYAEGGYSEELYPLADSALYETKSGGRAGFTMVDAEGKVIKRWKDPASKGMQGVLAASHIGVSCMEYPMEGAGKPRMYFNEDTRNLFCIPLEATPECCFEIWIGGIAPESLDWMDSAIEAILETGSGAYTYYWNHPVRGMVKIESGGTGGVSDGVFTTVFHHRMVFES